MFPGSCLIKRQDCERQQTRHKFQPRSHLWIFDFFDSLINDPVIMSELDASNESDKTEMSTPDVDEIADQLNKKVVFNASQEAAGSTAPRRRKRYETLTISV